MSKCLKNYLTYRRILSRLSIATPHFSPLGKRIKMQAFIAFAAQKFGSFKDILYLCRCIVVITLPSEGRGRFVRTIT